MAFLLAAIVGAGLGVLMAGARTPVIRPLQLASGVALVFVLVATVGFSDVVTLPVTLTFVAASIAAAALYPPAIWMRELPELPLTYWQWVAREFKDPSFARSAYRVRIGVEAYRARDGVGADHVAGR